MVQRLAVLAVVGAQQAAPQLGTVGALEFGAAVVAPAFPKQAL